MIVAPVRVAIARSRDIVLLTSPVESVSWTARIIFLLPSPGSLSGSIEAGSNAPETGLDSTR